jgi:hypothetical protein
MVERYVRPDTVQSDLRKGNKGFHDIKTSLDTVMTRKMYRGSHVRKTSPDTARTKKREQRLSSHRDESRYDLYQEQGAVVVMIKRLM